ncbi:hypothetical protein [Streptomyces sp. NPDC051662]|uniref:hypothetical protein n=1 Tax=Streptomyces sp. NPDC051662 TaxID=3154750 RepID=UPI0034336D32
MSEHEERGEHGETGVMADGAAEPVHPRTPAPDGEQAPAPARRPFAFGFGVATAASTGAGPDTDPEPGQGQGQDQGRIHGRSAPAYGDEPGAPGPRTLSEQPAPSDHSSHSTPMTAVVDPGTPPPPLPPAPPQPDAVAPTASTVTPPNGTAIPEEDEPV